MCLSVARRFRPAFQLPFQLFAFTMHIPSHSPALPDGVDPIPMPGSPRETEMLLILLDMGLYPKIVPAKSEAKSEKERPGEG